MNGTTFENKIDMGLLDDYSGEGGLMGIGKMPRPKRIHQRVLKNLVSRFDKNFRKQGYEALTEDAIAHNPEKAPDVVFYETSGNDESQWVPKVFVEVTTTDQVRKIIDESTKLMKRLEIKEAFVYDYQANKWHKLYDAESITPTFSHDDYSDIFSVRLNQFVENGF